MVIKHKAVTVRAAAMKALALKGTLPLKACP